MRLLQRGARFAILLIIGCLAPAAVAAQSEPSKLWLTAGAAFTTVRGDCQTCEEDVPYRHGASFLANLGYRVNGRMDVGAEIAWMPIDSDRGQITTTHLDAIAQFRPWSSQGFFIKGGAGMAFVRNWVDLPGGSPVRQKALSVIIGAGWAFRPEKRVGMQIVAAQHVAALGDLQTGQVSVPDVVGNFWSIATGVVIR